MWELDYEESWVPKNWCFWTVVSEKTLESPLDCKKIQSVHSKGDQSCVFFGRTGWSWHSNTLVTWWEELTHLKRPWRWQRLRAGAEGDNRGWYGWIASPTQWTWVWVNSRSWWWAGRPCMLRFMGSQRVGQWLNWTESSVGKESACNAADPILIPGRGRSAGEGIGYPLQYSWASLVAQVVKNLPAMRETWLRSLGWEDTLEKGKATHFSILACRIPWTVWSMWLWKVGHNWATFVSLPYFLLIPTPHSSSQSICLQCVRVKSLQSCLTLWDPMDQACQEPPSKGFSR